MNPLERPPIQPDGGPIVSALKQGIRHLLRIDPQSFVTPLPDLSWIGSKVHGYPVPDGLLDRHSVCYCIGAGDDITFDTELAERYHCRVVIIDPTPEGRSHFDQVRDHITRGEPLWTHNGTPFQYRIAPERLDLLQYLEIGVWDQAQTMRFYEPTLDNYASHSVAMFQESGRYIELPVDRLSNIMRAEGHGHIDYLKIEIEGAEYRVLETIIEDRLDVRVIAVEYDEFWHAEGKGRGFRFRIRDSARKLLDAGYRLAHSTPEYKRLFVREDVFDALQARSRSQGHTPGDAGPPRPS